METRVHSGVLLKLLVFLCLIKKEYNTSWSYRTGFLVEKGFF